MKVYLVAISFLFILIRGNCQLSDYEVRSINIASGLPTNSIWEIYQDSMGVIWIGSPVGLMKFDGQAVFNYGLPILPGDPFYENIITYIQEIDNINLWLGTKAGICKFNRITKKYEYFTQEILNSYNLNKILVDNDNEIWMCLSGIAGLYNLTKDKIYQARSDTFNFYNTNNIFQISDDHFLVSTTSQGFFTLNKRTDEIKKIFPENPMEQKPMLVFEDSKEEKWFYCRKGLYKLKINSWDNIEIEKTIDLNQELEAFHNIAEDGEGNFWIIAVRKTMVLNPNTKSFNMLSDFDIRNKMNINDLNRLYVDRDGNHWISHKKSGISLMYNPQFNINIIKKGTKPEDCLNDAQVKDLFVLNSDEILMSTQGGGLNIYNLKSKSCKYFTLKILDDTKYFGENNRFTHIFQYSDSIFWTTNDVFGLYIFDLSKGTFTKDFNYKTIKSIDTCIFSKILKDKSGFYWFSTNDNGLLKIDLERDTVLKHYHKESDEEKYRLTNNSVNTFIIDSTDILWIATDDGVFVVDKKEKLFHLTENSPNNKLWSNKINCLYLDKKNDVWIGSHNGLHRYIRSARKLKRYPHHNDQSANSIWDISQDNNGILWVGSKKEMVGYKLAPNNDIDIFSPYGYLPESSSMFGIHNFNDSIMAIASPNGAILFNPENWYLKKNKRKVFISKIETADENNIGKTISFPMYVIDTLKEISLSHKQNTFSLEFTTLEYINFGASTFYYQLKGFDKSWRIEKNQHKITYANIPPGEYDFMVKAFNKIGLWETNEKLIKIIIIPAFWQKREFKTVISICVLLLIFIIPFRIIRRMAIQKLELEEQVTKRTIKIKNQNVALQEQSQELKRLNNTKDKLFNILAHDLKDPFNQILGFSNLLKKNFFKYSDDKKYFQIELINNSAQRFYNLLENMLSWARTQTNRLTYSPTNNNLNTLIIDTIKELDNIANSKQITIVHNPENEYSIYADASLFTIVLRNLITNAIKFTDKDGLIIIGSRKTEDKIEITVQDSGHGIPYDKQNEILSEDDVISSLGTEGEKGTGLGLLICKEIVKTNKGEIWFHSTPNEGTTFYFTVPSYQ